MRKFAAGVFLGFLLSLARPAYAWDIDAALKRMSDALVEISATLKRMDTKMGPCRTIPPKPTQ